MYKQYYRWFSLILCFLLLIGTQSYSYAVDYTDAIVYVNAPEELSSFLDGKEETDLVPLWLFFKGLSNDERDALIRQIEIPKELTDQAYYQAYHAERLVAVKEYYTALLNDFTIKYLDDACEVIYWGWYSGTMIVEVPILLLDELIQCQMLEAIALYKGAETEAFGDEVIMYPPLDDVTEGAYYYEAMLWAFQSYPKITNGTTPKTFSPNRPCTRAEAVTFLWRACGCPKPIRTDSDFTDIKPDTFYFEAVLWAREAGITQGVTSATFCPNDFCSRGQIVTFLWRLCGAPKQSPAQTRFEDVKPNAYYSSAISWALENGITEGMTPALFQPDNVCTRAQIVTFLFRLLHESD